MANDYDIALKLSLDQSNAQAGLRQFTAQVKGSFDDVDKSAKASGKSIDDAFKVLGTRSNSKIKADIDRISTSLRTLGKDGTLSGNELARAQKAAAAQIAVLKREASGATAQMAALKSQSLKAGAAALAIGLGVNRAAQSALTFNQNMAQVSTLLDDTSGMDKLTQSVRDLSKEYGSNVNVNAKALYDIISAGATKSADAISELDAANKLALGGKTDVSTAADGLTSALNAYNLTAKDAGNVSDAFFVAVKAGKTTVAELSASIGQVAPIANTAGVSLDQLLSGIAAITASGVKTPAAITGIRAALVNIIQPSAQAQKLANELGIEFDAQALKAQGLQGFLNNVARATGGNVSQMSQFFSSVEGLNAALTLTGAGAGKFTDTLDAMQSKAGQTDKAVAKMMDTPAARQARFISAIDDMAISLGDATTAAKPLITAATDLINAFNNLPGPVRSTAAGLLLIVAAAVPAALGIRALYTAGKLLRSLALAETLTAVPGAIRGIGTAAEFAVPRLTKLSLIRSASKLGVAGVVGFTAVELYQLIAAMREAQRVKIELANAPTVKRQNLQTTIDINATGADTTVATRSELERMSAFEYANYTKRLQQAKDYYAAKRDLLSQNLKPNESPSADALAAAGEARKYTEALADLKIYQSDRATAEANFNSRLSTIKAAQTQIITNAIADQLRKYQDANKALADLQKQRADIEARFQQSADNLGVQKNAPAPDIVAVQAAVQKAQGLQQDGDLKGAAAAAEQARQLIDAANAAGTVSDYFLKDFLARAKDVALAANQGQQTAAQSQIDGYKASIEALKSAADWMKQLTIGYDTAAAIKSTADLQTQLQALLAQNPLVQRVVLQKPDAADKSATDIVNTPSVPATPGYATGGAIRGPGSGTSDSILARLSNGEFVLKAAAVRAYGVDYLHALNNLRLPKFASGGLVANLDIPALNTSGTSGGTVAATTGNGNIIYLTIGGQQHGPLTAEDSVAKTLKRAAAMFGSAR